MLRAAIEQFGDKTDDEIAFGNIFSVWFFLKVRDFSPSIYVFWNLEQYVCTYLSGNSLHTQNCLWKDR